MCAKQNFGSACIRWCHGRQVLSLTCKYVHSLGKLEMSLGKLCCLLVHLNIVCVLFQIDCESIENNRFCNFWELADAMLGCYYVTLWYMTVFDV